MSTALPHIHARTTVSPASGRSPSLGRAGSALFAPDGPGTHRSWRAGWFALALTALARSVLTMIGSLVLCAVIPAAAGWTTTVVMSASMAPRLMPGDVVAARPIPPEQVRPGQVLLVTDPDHADRLRLHRMVAVRPDGLLTLRGDANTADDSTPVARSAVRGVGALRAPLVGLPSYWLRTGQTGNLLLLLVGLGALAAASCAFRGSEDLDGPGGRRTGGRGRRHGRHRPTIGRGTADSASTRTLRRVITATITAGAVFAGWSAPAHAASFTRTSTNPGNTWSAAPYFSCVDAVNAARPSLFYPLSDSTGTTATNVAGVDGSYNGGVALGAAGPCARDGHGVTLNGSTGWVSNPAGGNAPSVFTLEIWFRTTTTRGGVLFGFNNGKTGNGAIFNDRHLYLTNSGQLAFQVYSGTSRTILSPATYNDGQWHLADAVLSPAGMAMYVDGAPVSSDPTVTTAQSYYGSWRVGYDGMTNVTVTPSSMYLAGTIAQAAVYPGALTPAQIADHYNAS